MISVGKKSCYAIQTVTITCGTASPFVQIFKERKVYLPINVILVV